VAATSEPINNWRRRRRRCHSVEHAVDQIFTKLRRRRYFCKRNEQKNNGDRHETGETSYARRQSEMECERERVREMVTETENLEEDEEEEKEKDGKKEQHCVIVYRWHYVCAKCASPPLSPDDDYGTPPSLQPSVG